MQLKLYVFSSSTLTNIWAGIGARLWAVSQRDDAQLKGLITKAREMSVGSLGIFYCTEVQSLTTPFLIYSTPQGTEPVSDVWPQHDRWILPFKIHPLGTPRKRMHKDQAMTVLPSLVASGKTNITHVLPIPAATVFSPALVTGDDWELLLEHLAE